MYQKPFYKCKTLYLLERKLNELVFAASTAGETLPESPLPTPEKGRMNMGKAPDQLSSTDSFKEVSISKMNKALNKLSVQMEEIPILPSDTSFTDCLNKIEPGKQSIVWVPLVENSCAQKECVPVMIAKGVGRGPKMGLTAALHGNELNGIPLIFRLFRDLDLSVFLWNISGSYSNKYFRFYEKPKRIYNR